MSDEQFDALLQFFKALANESRLKIIGLLANGDLSVSELAESLKLKEPTVSHHLSQLKELGLVEKKARGNLRIYSLNMKAMERLNRDMFSQTKIAALVNDKPRESEDEKILRRFVDDNEEIIAIPHKQKKQLIILRWLVTKFERDRDYHELEVNAIIKKHHLDTAYLRRRMISFGLMARERNTYWRIDDLEEKDDKS